MKVLIVDDEPLARSRLKRLVEQCCDAVSTCEASNGHEALLASSEHNPDIVLLDIRMPVMDGLEVARHLSVLPNPPAVIFTTAYGDHALSAFESNAVDYLLKPIRKDRLEKALNSASKLNQAQLSNIQEKDEISARSHLSITERGNLILVPINTITCFIADQKYVRVLHDEGESLIEDSLKHLEEEFEQQFVRVHRNALAARNKLQGLEKQADGSHQLLFTNAEEKIEVSRRHLPAIRKLIKEKSN